MRTMRKFILLIALLTITAASNASPIPLDIKKVVTFIYYAKNPTNIAADGTGFLVLVPSPKETNVAFGYLVTARHVLRPSENNWLPFVFVRLNRRDGTSEMALLPLNTSGPN